VILFLITGLLSLVGFCQPGLNTLTKPPFATYAEGGIRLEDNYSSQDFRTHCSGTKKDDSEVLRQLPGNPDDLAWNALPYIEYNPYDYLDTDFHLEDRFYYPVRVMGVLFTAEATIGQINTLVSSIGGEIIGAWPGNLDRRPPIGLDLTLRVPTDSFDALFDLSDTLMGYSFVEVAIPLIFDGVPAVPYQKKLTGTPYFQVLLRALIGLPVN
jgi:hypothetical protein